MNSDSPVLLKNQMFNYFALAINAGNSFSV